MQCLIAVIQFREQETYCISIAPSFDKTRQRFEPSGLSREPEGTKLPQGCFE